MADKKYADAVECRVNKYVDVAVGHGYGPWHWRENAITQADKKAARDAADTAAENSAKAVAADIIKRKCPAQTCPRKNWVDKDSGTPLQPSFQILPQNRREGESAAIVFDFTFFGFHIRLVGYRWYVDAECEYQVLFECTE
jgi:hypothetical protein